MAGEWKTMSNKTNERQLAHEFTWEGNELESMTDHNMGRFYSFGYDEKGCIDHIYSNSDQDFSRVISYDGDGHVVKTVRSEVRNGSSPVSRLASPGSRHPSPVSRHHTSLPLAEPA